MQKVFLKDPQKFCALLLKARGSYQYLSAVVTASARR
jgi:hypothetical protein